MDIRNKRVTVVGLGNSGLEASLLLLREGAIVAVTDNTDSEEVRKNGKVLQEKYVNVEIARHTEDFLCGTELLVVSPGIENSALPISYAKKKNIPIVSEMELGYQFCKGRIVAITGTNGKSTVVSLLGEILSRAKIPVNVCGNIGNSLSGEIQDITEDTVVVLEVSSFQLEWIKAFRPKVSVILNIAPNHLDRHRDFEEYLNFKTRIFENQGPGDVLVLNYDDKILRGLVKSRKIQARILYFSAKEKVKGVFFDKGCINISFNKRRKNLFALENPKLKGAHNVENILAAVLAAELVGGDIASLKESVEGFTPLGHRFEKVAVIDGIEFIDDSKATNVDSTYRALLSVDRPVVLIAGGKDKNLSYEKIMPAVKKIVKKIIIIGETRNKMREIFKGAVALEEKDTLEEAVSAAYKSASSGDSVLLSPMCSSFDMFKSYKHRGEVFQAAVEKLKSNSTQI